MTWTNYYKYIVCKNDFDFERTNTTIQKAEAKIRLPCVWLLTPCKIKATTFK